MRWDAPRNERRGAPVTSLTATLLCVVHSRVPTEHRQGGKPVRSSVCFAELGSPGVGSQRTMNRSELHRVHLLACSLGPSALLRDNFALTHQHFILLQRVSSFRYETPRHAHAHAAGCGGRAGGRRNGGARASSTPACWLLCSFSCSSSPQLHALIGAMHTPVGRATA